MLITRLLFFAAVSVLAGCAGLYDGRQPPAPVFGGHPPVTGRYPSYPDELARPVPPPVVETKPLEGANKRPEMIEIKPDLPPPMETEVLHPGEQQPDSPALNPDANDPFAATPPTDDLGMPESEAPVPEQPAAEVVKPVAPPLPEIPKEPETLQPLESFAPQSPAVGALVLAANEDSQGGNLDSAAASIERAIRIEPRNAALYYKLAVIRLKQSKPRLAEDLAHKAAILAITDNTLKKHSWLLVANARTQQGNLSGAKQAKGEAAKY